MRVACLEVILKAKENLRLPSYKGAVIRGAFGNAFRRVTCPFRDRLCSECLLRAKCVYSTVFETPRPESSKIMRKYETVPHPFVIEPPLDEREAYAPGERLSFGLILMGPAISALPYFIYAFESMAETGLGRGRGRGMLLEIRQGNKQVYDGSDKTLKSSVVTKELENKKAERKTERILIRFLTPVRIIYDGRIAQSLDFHVLIRALIRRVGLLGYFFADNPYEIDYRPLIAQAQRVRTKSSRLESFSWRRYSTRQDRPIEMDGLIGEVSYEGDLSRFIPYLRIGETVHIGKGTVFGLGKYEMEVK